MKKFVFAIAVIFSFLPLGAEANVIINEVKISPTEERFIKLYNNGDSEVDLTNWYIQRKTQSGSSFGSLVSKINFENKKIGIQEYFLISRVSTMKSSIVLSDLTLTESNVIQIKNANGEVVDKVCWGEVNDCGDSKFPNPVSGQSILIGNQVSIVIAPAPTPSAELILISEPKTKVAEILKIKTQINTKMLDFVGLPHLFQAVAYGVDGGQLHYGKYFWNFGDGDSKEVQVMNSQEFNHIYYYPGEYTVSLSYYQNYYSDLPDASSQITIKIIEPNVSISKVGEEKDFFVELSNNTDYSANISNWILASEARSFSLPRNTILASKKTLIISPKITNFSPSDKSTLKLMTPQREIIFDYLSSVTHVVPIVVTPRSKPDVGRQDSRRQMSGPTDVSINTDKQGHAENVLASVSNSVVPEQSTKSLYTSPIFPLISLAFIGVGAGSVYFIRRKKVSLVDGNDFELLDE